MKQLYNFEASLINKDSTLVKTLILKVDLVFKYFKSLKETFPSSEDTEGEFQRHIIAFLDQVLTGKEKGKNLLPIAARNKIKDIS